MLFFGKTADLFGRKNQLLGGMAFLSLLSLITSFAHNPMAMNVLCGCVGLGTAAISPPAIGMLLATYPEGRRKNKAMGALGSGNPLGFIMGSLSSGLATKLYSWRASFIVVAIFFFVLTLFAVWTMPVIPRSTNVKQELKRFDWLGTVLTVMGVALLCAGLT
jgi:MFS family permease